MYAVRLDRLRARGDARPTGHDRQTRLAVTETARTLPGKTGRAAILCYGEGFGADKLSRLLLLTDEETSSLLDDFAAVWKARKPRYIRQDPLRGGAFLNDKALRKRFGRVLGRLSPAHRTLLLYRYRYGMPWNEACARTHYSKSAAMKINRRFRQTLLSRDQ